MREIIPTVVPATFDDVIAARRRYGAYASFLHIDASDSRFAPNKTWLPLSGEKLSDGQPLRFEAHLMLNNPLSIGVAFARAGAERIIGHVEAFDNAECAREAYDMWQKAGAKEIGAALLFDTPLEEFAPYSSLCDFVHLMTIRSIGAQGAAFEDASVQRIARFHARYPDLPISVDGGASAATIELLESAGASRFCVGSALAKAKDPEKEYAKLLNASFVQV